MVECTATCSNGALENLDYAVDRTSHSSESLRWMMKEVNQSGSRILFDPEKIDETTWSYESDGDAKSTSHISFKSIWWPLEFLPLLEKKQTKNGNWVLRPRCVTPCL